MATLREWHRYLGADQPLHPQRALKYMTDADYEGEDFEPLTNVPVVSYAEVLMNARSKRK